MHYLSRFYVTSAKYQILSYYYWSIAHCQTQHVCNNLIDNLETNQETILLQRDIGQICAYGGVET